MADEAHHRDVNHTFADMKNDDPNPFVTTHKGENYSTPPAPIYVNKTIDRKKRNSLNDHPTFQTM